MVTVGNRIDNRRLVQARSVATHAKRIILDRQYGLMRMGVVTIQAADTLVPHSTHLKGCENVVFFVGFAIHEISVRKIGKHQAEMVIEFFSRLETVGSQLLSSCMATSTVIHRQIDIQLGFHWLIISRPGSDHMLLHSRMALHAGDSLNFPLAVIRSGPQIVILLEVRHVAPSAV